MGVWLHSGRHSDVRSESTLGTSRWTFGWAFGYARMTARIRSDCRSNGRSDAFGRTSEWGSDGHSEGSSDSLGSAPDCLRMGVRAVVAVANARPGTGPTRTRDAERIPRQIERRFVTPCARHLRGRLRRAPFQGILCRGKNNADRVTACVDGPRAGGTGIAVGAPAASCGGP